MSNNEYIAGIQTDLIGKLQPLFAYIPYLKDKEGYNTSALLDGDMAPKESVPVPVYDPKVLAFVKEAQKTGLINRNYIYPYKKLGIASPRDERLAISGAKFKDIDGVIAIMSKYVLGGMTKGYMWAEAVEEGIWLHCLLKLKELLEMHDHPLA
ncbi:MAG: hypothetical protein K5870_02445 [Lachnospiraceae bacterium]|nr:hypothetical protein [Lachnospiraceae bacterium]